MVATTIQEKIQEAIARKDQGNDEFKKGNLTPALTQYYQAILYLKGLDTDSAGLSTFSQSADGAKGQGPKINDKEKDQVKTLIGTIYANMGAVHLKNKNYARTIAVCTDALKADPTNAKAKFRRAQAKVQEGNIAGAEADLKELNQEDASVKAEWIKIRNREKEALAKQRKTMGGFLSRGRILNDEEEREEAAAAAAEAAAASAKAAADAAAKLKSSGKPKPKSKNGAPKKATASKAEEYEPTTSWSGSQPKIQELADGEE